MERGWVKAWVAGESDKLRRFPSHICGVGIWETGDARGKCAWILSTTDLQSAHRPRVCEWDAFQLQSFI